MTEQDFLSFEGRPLVRSGDTIIYGEPWGRFFCKLKLVDIADNGSFEAAGEVLLVVVDNSIQDKKKRNVVRKKCEDLGSAILFAKNWLDTNDK